jgi:hypothetical protein
MGSIPIAAPILVLIPIRFSARQSRVTRQTGITTVILGTVKTAISIPDVIFEEAERLAKIRGWSRSQLYANAVSAYVDSERFLGVREKLNAVYGQNADDSAIDPDLAKAQARSVRKEKW